MSVLFYLASDHPLEERPNPHMKTMSVNEALAFGITDIPDPLLKPGFDRDKPDVILWSDIDLDARAEGDGLDDDFSIWKLDPSTEDIYTEKKYRVYLEWNYTRGRAEQVIQYVREQLKHTDELEIWHIWMGNGDYPKIRKCTIGIDELTPDDLKELYDMKVEREPTVHYCFVIQA